MPYILGIDIGGTKCAVVLGQFESQIKILDKISFATEADKGPEYAIGRIFEGIESLCRRNQLEFGDIEGIGISCGGPLDSKRGIILSPPNLPGWDRVPLVDLLEGRYGIRAKLQNDANACALAEWKFGAARGYRNVVFLTFGTGMGAGLILNGRLYSGTNDMAGEIGHIRMSEHGPVGYGKAGSFEGFCSGNGIAQLARTKVLERIQRGEEPSFCKGLRDLENLSAKMVAEAAFAGDELAKEVFEICGEYLGRGLAVLIDILNPEIIVIGSIFARCRELLWPSAVEAIERESLALSRGVCRIVPAALGEQVGDYAALAVALE